MTIYQIFSICDKVC